MTKTSKDRLLTPFSRRAVLKGAAGAAVAVPWLEAFNGAAAQELPKRVVFFFTPNATIGKNFWPEKEGSDFELSPILKPLEAHREQLLVLGGIDNIASKMGPGDAHQKGMGSCLTGNPLLEGEFQGMGGQIAGWASHRSVDQAIAEKLKGRTKFSSLEFGVGINGAHVGTRLAYAGANRPVPPEANPYAMFERIFGGSTSGSRKQRRRQLVLDRVRQQYDGLQGKLGKRDREKLQAHLESIQSIESQLQAPDIDYGGACSRPMLNAGLDPRANDSIPAIGRLQMDLLAASFACDASRVATFMYTNSVSTAIYNWLAGEHEGKSYPIKDGHHDIAHKGNEEAIFVAQHTAINNFFMKELSYLVDKLKAIPEGDGNVFDNTMIVVVNEQASGNDHRREDMPYIILGNAGGAIKSGRYVRYAKKLADRATGERGLPHNRLLASLLKTMDVDPTGFTNPELDSTPLPDFS